MWLQANSMYQKCLINCCSGLVALTFYAWDHTSSLLLSHKNVILRQFSRHSTPLCRCVLLLYEMEVSSDTFISIGFICFLFFCPCVILFDYWFIYPSLHLCKCWGHVLSGLLGLHGSLNRYTSVDYLASECMAWVLQSFPGQSFNRADSRFAPSQWETVSLCNDVSHWLGASLESARINKSHDIWTVNHSRELCSLRRQRNNMTNLI